MLLQKDKEHTSCSLSSEARAPPLGNMRSLYRVLLFPFVPIWLWLWQSKTMTEDLIVQQKQATYSWQIYLGPNIPMLLLSTPVIPVQ